MPDDFFALMIDELFRQFKDVLHGSRIVDRDSGAGPNEERNQNQYYKELHGKEVRNRSGWIVSEKIRAALPGFYRMRAERRQNTRRDPAEILVQELRKK